MTAIRITDYGSRATRMQFPVPNPGEWNHSLSQGPKWPVSVLADLGHSHMVNRLLLDTIFGKLCFFSRPLRTLYEVA